MHAAITSPQVTTLSSPLKIGTIVQNPFQNTVIVIPPSGFYCTSCMAAELLVLNSAILSFYPFSDVLCDHNNRQRHDQHTEHDR